LPSHHNPDRAKLRFFGGWSFTRESRNSCKFIGVACHREIARQGGLVPSAPLRVTRALIADPVSIIQGRARPSHRFPRPSEAHPKFIDELLECSFLHDST